MAIARIYAITWSVAFWLPALMGAIEYLLRVALVQPGKDAFFPISLVASGISTCVTVAMLPSGELDAVARIRLEQRLKRVIFIANLGFLASLFGVLLWIYLLVASFNDAVRALLPFHPFWESSVYYVVSIGLNYERAKVLKC